MHMQDFFPDAIACDSINEGFDPLMEWLDMHPDRDVSEFAGWREVASSPRPLTAANSFAGNSGGELADPQ